MLGASQEFNAGTLQNSGMNIVELLCEAASQPVTMMVRPFYGTRFYSVVSMFLAATMMILLPAFMATVQGVAHMIPFVNIPMPRGMFSLGDFAELYFLVAFAQGLRMWRRMLYPEKEECSVYEGPALFFFNYLPKSRSFYFVRIVWEPVAVLLVSIVLQDLYIIQSPLSLYLKFAAFAMMMCSFIAWFRSWEVERIIRDSQWTGRIMSKIADGSATQSERDQILVASIPRGPAAQAAPAAGAYVARTQMQETNANPKGGFTRE
jgi:hypothetical protein